MPNELDNFKFVLGGEDDFQCDGDKGDLSLSDGLYVGVHGNARDFIYSVHWCLFF